MTICFARWSGPEIVLVGILDSVEMVWSLVNEKEVCEGDSNAIQVLSKASSPQIRFSMPNLKPHRGIEVKMSGLEDGEGTRRPNRQRGCCTSRANSCDICRPVRAILWCLGGTTVVAFGFLPLR